MNTNQTQPNTGTDMDALNLTHAIALSESGSGGKPNYNAKGASGEHGAYQWMPGNFESGAKSAGLDPNDFSPMNQDKVAYAQVKEYKDKGYDPGQISSLWNSGSPNNWQNHSGTNKMGVNYDTPAYVKKVQQNYQQLKGTQSGYNPTPYSQPTNGNVSPDNSVANLPDNPPQKDTSLGSELIGRTNDAGQAIADTVSGKQNIFSGLLQTGGAIAGGLGDIVNKGLEMIPGVKQVENLLGQGVGALAKTAPGQAVVKSINDFSTAHPELSKDIGAGFNIVTAIPILRGLGAVGRIGMEAGSQALKDVVVKGFSKDLASSGGKIAQRVFTPDVVDTSIKYGVAPEIKSVGGKTITDTTLAQANLEKEVSKIEDIYQSKLKGVDLKFPIDGVKNIANDISVENLSDPNAVSKILDRVAAKYGENPTLEQLNQAKRDITKKISDAGFADPDLSNNRIARMALQQATEKAGLQFGAGDLNAINKQMGSILNTIDFYEKIDGMTVKQGLLHKGIKAVSTGVGAGIGGMFGNPIAGGAIGYGASDYAEGLLTKATPRAIRAGVIKRTGSNAVGLSKKELAKKMGYLFGGVVGQKLNQNKQ